MDSQAHRCTEALQGHLDVPDDSLSHPGYKHSTSTSPNTTPGVAAASNISSPGAAAHDPPLPLTPLRLESIRVDCQSPLVPRQPSGHSLARLKHSQSAMVSLGGMPRASTMERWHSPLLVSPWGRALSVALPRGSPCPSSLRPSSSRPPLVWSPLEENAEKTAENPYNESDSV